MKVDARVLMALALVASVGGAEAKGILDVPVASITNKVYLSDMSGRPWWNKAWRKRAAILVANPADARDTRATIDFIFDPGEKVDPKSVRVVTPWDAEVPCVCVPKRRTDTLVRSDKDDSSSRKNGQECPFSENGQECPLSGNGQECPFSEVEIIFETELRERENKPFFIYWDNPAAEAPSVFPLTAMTVNDAEIRINNGVLDVVFDNLHRTQGLLKNLKVLASPAKTELLWRTSGFAWQGFGHPNNDKPCTLSKGIVLADNAFKKSIAFTNAGEKLTFTLYAGQPRVDYAYELANGGGTTFAIAWACGGGAAYDDFTYMGLSGKLLTFRAALDHVTDCMPQPEYYGFPWLSEGWYAISDRKTKDVVGTLFDRDAFQNMWYLGQGQCDGAMWQGTFSHRMIRKPAGGSGALYANVGSVDDLRREYALLKNRPRVFVTKTQPYAEIPVVIPNLEHDYCANINVGGWRAGKPLPGDEWAPNVIDHIRALGANVILNGQLTYYGWPEIPITKDLYDRICAYMKKRNPNWKPRQEWSEKYDGRNLKRICAEAHSNGMAVCSWHGPLPEFLGYGDPFSEEEHGLNREIQQAFPACGVDSAYNAKGGGEQVPIPPDLKKKFGDSYWKWDDPQPFFDSRKWIGNEMKKFYEYSHKVHPDAPVMVFNSENGELGRDMCMGYFPGAMDTLFCELVAGMNYSKIKHAVKRLRGYFDNADGKTIHAHYYCMNLDYKNRISENELPFICGMNGFSQESITYENFDRDLYEVNADFFRFALYTQLGPKVAKMGPVKNLAVLRDMNCFEEDCRKKRTFGRGWWQASRHDARVNAFAEIPSYNYDIVINPYFKADSLSRYKVVYLTDDEVLTEELAKEALAFVKQGGGLVLEGSVCQGEDALATKNGAANRQGEDALATKNGAGRGKGVLALAKLGLKDGIVAPYGAGKIVWTKEVLTDPLMKGDKKAAAKVKALVASVGGEVPFTITKANGQECPFSGVGANGQECPFSDLDGILQASKDGMFLGVFNKGKVKGAGQVTLCGKGVLALADGKTISASQGGDALATTKLFVLDVKAGVRQPLSPSNTFEIAVGPEQCGFYLIGGDAFTAIPETTEAAWAGAAIASVLPMGNKPPANPDPKFRPHVAVEFTSVRGEGEKAKAIGFSRSRLAGLECRRFVAEESALCKQLKLADLDAWKVNNPGVKTYKSAAFAAALKEADYVHFNADPKLCDAVFADCAEELKALLKRGGGLLFDKNGTGPNARAFLKEVGVFDPYPSAQWKKGDGEVKWNESFPTNHPLLALSNTAKDQWHRIQRDGTTYRRAFTAWDREKQLAPFVLARDPNCSHCIIQGDVLGAGKVVFNENSRSFDDWYEAKTYGDSIVSWFIGMFPKDHAKKAQFYVGGIGNVVE